MPVERDTLHDQGCDCGNCPVRSAAGKTPAALWFVTSRLFLLAAAHCRQADQANISLAIMDGKKVGKIVSGNYRDITKKSSNISGIEMYQLGYDDTRIFNQRFYDMVPKHQTPLSTLKRRNTSVGIGASSFQTIDIGRSPSWLSSVTGPSAMKALSASSLTNN